MASTLSDRASRFFKIIREGVRTHSQNRTTLQFRKLMPIFYLFLGSALALNAHTSSQESGIETWLQENPPSLAMISGELTHKGFARITHEPTSRHLYRAFPYKNSKPGILYFSRDTGCIAITPHPEKTPTPTFFCQEPPLSKTLKLDWKLLGFGWAGLSELQKLSIPPKKPISPHVSYDPREIRY